jgi:hypothetical protein
LTGSADMVTTVTRDGGNENGRQVVVEATWRPKGQREVNSTRRFRRLQDFATKKNGEVLKTSLMIPKCAELPANFAISIQQQLSTIDDINAIEDGRRRLLALQTYFTKKENKQEVEIAARWCEVRIGELLGPAEQTHPGKKASHAREVLPKNDRHNFRLMAQNKKIVERSIASGKITRNKIIEAIKVGDEIEHIWSVHDDIEQFAKLVNKLKPNWKTPRDRTVIKAYFNSVIDFL